MEEHSDEDPNIPTPSKLMELIGEEEVMSDVHLGCPPNFSGPYVSHFSFSLPHVRVKFMGIRCDESYGHIKESSSMEQTIDLDEDGDLLVARRTKQLYYTGVVSIQHNITSTISSVGLQVWRAELILADYVLHKMSCSSVFNGVVAVELGAGTGLVGILIARVAESVFITDHGVEILDNCARNVHTNSGLLVSEFSVKVRELDWQKPWPPLDLDSGVRYSWTSSEVEEFNKASVLLAADVIYSDELTDAFFRVLEKLMCQHSEKVLYLALEKRYNFSLYDLDIVANGYSHFLSFLRDEKGFTGKRIDLSEIPQYMREYERGNDVEIWEIHGFDDDTVTTDHKTMGSKMKHCCCCNELWNPRRQAHTLLQAKSVGFDDNDLDLDLIDLKKEVKSLQPSNDVGKKPKGSLDQFGYTELEVNSDAESDVQMSDAEDMRPLISNDPLRDIILDSTPRKPFLAVSENESTCDKPIDVGVLLPESSETLHLVASDISGPHDGPSVALASSISHGLEELNWQEIDINLDPSASTYPMPSYSVSVSPNDGNVYISSSIDDSNVEEEGILEKKVDVKDLQDMDIKEPGVVQTLVNETDKIQELDSLQPTRYLNCSKGRSEHKDDALQMPNHLDLGDAYQLAISSKGRQLSGKLAEQLAGKESPRVSTDLKLLLSQFSRGSEIPLSDILSPRVSRNLDEFKAYDSSTSIGMKILHKRLSLERNDSKTSLDRNGSGAESLDFSIVSEIEGESELDRLRRQHEHDRKLLFALLKELEEERNASAIAANETMAMITRLQEEKAALQMEASHDLRMMEEQAEYDMEALDKYNDLVTEKEKEIQDLEAELVYYRTKYPNESTLEIVGESASNACLSDSVKTRGSPNNFNASAENREGDSLDQLLTIEDERKYISECLVNLAKKLTAYCCNSSYSDLTNGDRKVLYDPKLHEEDQFKSENVIISEKVGFVPSGNNQTLVRRFHSFEKSRSAGAEQGAVMLKEADIAALVYEVSSLSKRLQALEADRSFIEHSVNALQKGEEGLIQEIASHLRELRKIGVRRCVKVNPLER